MPPNFDSSAKGADSRSVLREFLNRSIRKGVSTGGLRGNLASARASARNDPRAGWKAALVVLLLLNLVAGYFTMQPLGGTAEELDSQLVSLRAQVQRTQADVIKLRAIVSKMDKSQTQQTEFMKTYFMDRRTASSDILTEIGSSAKKAGLKPKEHAFLIEPVEGSDSISMMTITANYEGTYSDLVHFVNEVDRSKRFLIIENITAAPQQIPGMLASRFKINTFVREARP